MSESTSSGDKSSDKSSSSKTKGSGSGDSSGGDAGKSAKESVGGAKEVHYGFFSSVRTPAYRSGWDEIWGNKNSAGAERPKRANTKATAKPGSKPKLRTVELKIDDLPDDVRDGLIEATRKKMRRSRASYDQLEATGSVEWTISVKVHGGG